MNENQLNENDNTLNGWISEKRAMALTCLKKTSLYNLRKEKKIEHSKINSKNFYLLSSIIKLLEQNRNGASK